MSNKFKVGDKVRIKEVDSWLIRHGKNAGDVLTVNRVVKATFEVGRILLVFDELLAAAPGHERFSERFELVPDEPARKFKVGDRVRCVLAGGYPEVSTGEVFVVAGYDALQDGAWLLKLEERGRGSSYYEHRFEPHVEPPRDYRLMRNGNIASTPHTTPEEVADYARKSLSDSVEFDIVEIVTVSKHTVRKVVEART
ncbi:hypothetical protein [Ralstonia pseudosolanacearum]|uniref:hypothetical protein n=1 Tax=Ralstonia pseudosolanacearum TaxID=1310165 RepID=UPI00048D9AC8|nr:hypothetical protein [Ralstonia pseudosolanacearum]MDO3559421.1 hypothetical protein [Ralstonia pseudosolanacearum]MDO3579067.1 hypothetical protein [Ralstonia pseudosolanacearum]MDO3588766.1 hypothetical protein [Ralstonia pseudosolanacearum]